MRQLVDGMHRPPSLQARAVQKDIIETLNSTYPIIKRMRTQKKGECAVFPM